MKKEFLKHLGFSPKENTTEVFVKKYSSGYCIEVDFGNQAIFFGGAIKIGNKDIQKITKPEDWVVFECVNKLLEIGYNPKNVILEKVYPAGHGFSGRLDICVTRDDGSEYLLIECKTYGKEFDTAFSKLKKDGGQLFTYFKFSNKADIIMLYASQFHNNEIIYTNEIVKIEDLYRTGDVKDFYKNWNKQTSNFGVWENNPYDFKTKIFTKKDLIELNDKESTKIFHEFASILRKHSVSDKPNAFNKIFNLFLAKLYDEAKRDDDELEFQWRNNDNPVDFQVRLVNLHKNGLYAFLEKEIEGIQDSDFKYTTTEELLEKKKKVLKFNNVLAIKEVLDDASFDENQRVLKDVVKLLEKYQIRYPRKQQHLSDFFEKLLTTGLKQEVGQYFTPPPITKFIVRSLPIKQMIEKEVNKETPELPAIIDYAAGSGHFITEAMEEYQDTINAFSQDDIKNFYPKAIKQVKSWQADPYEWAAKYVYGIEKDYRLVKVAKVGCYFYGDGVAQIIHGDGLDSFETSKTYKGLLKENTNLEDSSKAKFSLVLSNPPYSVNDCKDDLEYIGAQDEFSIYPYLSDKSRDIECLFMERTKHLLKDGGIASIILPSSILTNTGIQTKTREIILQNFEVIAITELGGNTFMATNTNTVVLFLRRRTHQDITKIKEYIQTFFSDFKDNTILGIENPISKYVSHVWKDITFHDYISLLKKSPNGLIESHEIYKEYRKKIKAKKESEFWGKLSEVEQDKLTHFILAYSQKNIVLIKTGEKDDEKKFLGYYFSDRRGGEGMHPMQGDSIDASTKLYNSQDSQDTTKASSYIYHAFLGNPPQEIHESLKQNISYIDLLDMLTFDRAEFEKQFSLNAKKKVKIESKWSMKCLGDITDLYQPKTITSQEIKSQGKYEVFGANGIIGYYDAYNHEFPEVVITCRGATCGTINYTTPFAWITGNAMVCTPKDKTVVSKKYLQYILEATDFSQVITGTAQPQITRTTLSPLQIPLPPLDIQQIIVDEMGELEKIEKKNNVKIEVLKAQKENLFESSLGGETKEYRLSDSDIFELGIGKRLLKSEILAVGSIPVYSANVFEPFGFVDENLLEDFSQKSVLWGIDGDWMVNYIDENIEFYPTDHCGFLRIKKGKLDERFVEYFLRKEGQNFGFSRTKRASIDRIQNLKISLPPLETQKKIVAEIEKIENEIEILENDLKSIPERKKQILHKYL